MAGETATAIGWGKITNDEEKTLKIYGLYDAATRCDIFIRLLYLWMA